MGRAGGNLSRCPREALACYAAGFRGISMHVRVSILAAAMAAVACADGALSGSFLASGLPDGASA